jgi:alcohol dehydrogenase (cytochrome c)
MYMVLRDGVKGTAMVSPDISRTERWQVIGYLRTLMRHGAGHDDVDKQTKLHIDVSGEQLLSAGSRSDEWLTYSGSFDGRRYTPLAEIKASNISKLRVRWVQQFRVEQVDNTDPVVEATPLVVGGVIFTTQPPSNLVALDARTGREIWRYDYPVRPDTIACCGRYNRGVAILGQRLFLNSLDAHLVAIDANTGKVIWDTPVADNAQGYGMTGAPLVAGQSVIVGVSNGDLGIRGFLAAYDPATGRQLWKFNTVPGPGEPGRETWAGGSWQTGGGATWAPGSYDPALDLVYWGVGNPAPDYSGDTRGGDNLYTNSVIALHPSTGKLEWYYQFLPHDEHDWDSTQTPILTELSIDGASHKVICWANRNGFYYVLDRVTGKFLTAAPFVEQNWNKGFDPKGRPIPADEGPNVGRLTRPAFSGGTNWQNPALDAKRGLVFVHATEGASVFTKSPEGVQWNSPTPGQPFLASGAATLESPIFVVRALDVSTGTRKWEHYAPPTTKPSYSGLLATGGGLVFGAESGNAFALDSDTGREVWRVHLGGPSQAPPISFTLDGRQVIAFSSGRAMFLFGL